MNEPETTPTNGDAEPWPDPLPEGVQHMSLLVQIDRHDRPGVPQLIADLPRFLAQHLPNGTKVGIGFLDLERCERVVLSAPSVTVTVPDTEAHEEDDYYGDDVDE